MTKYLSILLLGIAIATSHGMAAPANDSFENRVVLPYLTTNAASASGTNNGATNDFITGGYYINSPVWYEWTTIGEGQADVNVVASFDSVLSIYVSLVDNPTSVDDLLMVGYDDDGGNGLNSYLTSSDPGVNVTYYIAVSSYSSITGDFILSAQQGLVEFHDNFSAPLLVPGKAFKIRGLNQSATTETNEPKHANISNQKSVWFKWNTAERRNVKLDTVGSAFDTVLAVYKGTSLSTLQKVAFNDDISTGINPVRQSQVSFVTEPGVDYRIAVSSKNGESGLIFLNLQSTPRAPDFVAEPKVAYLQENTDGALFIDTVGTGTISYQWQVKQTGGKTWTDLVNNATYSGVTTATLGISDIAFALNGNVYRVVATDSIGTSISKGRTLVVTELAALNTTVGATESLDLTNAAPPPVGTTYYVKGLPKGFVLDPATGLVTTTGSTTPKPGSYPVTYGTTTIINGKKVSSPPITVLIVVSPLSADLSGAFEAILEDATTDAPFGKLELQVVSTTRAFTGKLTTSNDAKTLSIKGLLAVNSTFDTATSSLVITRKGSTPYRLDFTINATGATPVLSATLHQLNSSSVVVSTLADTVSGVQIAPFTSAAPSAWAGNYNLILDDPDDHPVNLGGGTAPEGIGYASAVVDKKRGFLAIKGKLGDGTALTASLAPAADGSYRVYTKPYKTGGYFGGWLEFSPNSGITAPYKITGTADSELYWAKSASTANDKGYRAGFGPVGIVATARPWTPPGTLVPVIATLSMSDSLLNASLASTNLPVADQSLLPTSITLMDANTFAVNLPSANADRFVAKVKSTNGTITGSIILQDSRKVVVEGLILQQPSVDSGTVIGEGFFTIPAAVKGGESTTGKLLITAP